MFIAVGTSGVHMSEDRGSSWRLISDGLPTQAASAVAWTPEGGPDGTVVVVTGEHTFGAASYLGAGVWWSRDLGASWNRSTGPLDDAFGFDIEVDPTDQKVIYAATGKGLWRSADAGVTFTDVALPVGEVGEGIDCTSVYDDPTNCQLANMVTSIEVKTPGGVGSDTDGGDVVAAVGWRGGKAINPHTGLIQSPGNGIYISEDGTPGSYTRQDGLGEAAGGVERLGRVEMGGTNGPAQDHDYLYAIVQDAPALNGEIVDFQDNILGANATVLNGIYVSDDFGTSWTVLETEDELSDLCLVSQSVYCINGLIEPGAQSWYNQWIEPDPSSHVGGVPDVVVMGLEELWATQPGTPANNQAVKFTVIGKYYGCESPAGLLTVGECVYDDLGQTSTHPDQHAGLFVTRDEGTRLYVGNDGGVASQLRVPTGYNNLSWDLLQNNHLNTLLPYEADIANDGVAYMALQDNGHAKLHPDERNKLSSQFGGDGVWTRVDPENSDYVWESVQGAIMNVSSDGGRTWTSAEPPSDNKQFVPAAEMDPLDANHVVAGGTQINETLLGPDTTDATWIGVFDLGDSDQGVANIQTAIDVRGDAIYTGYCGTCDILNKDVKFDNGIATNIGHDVDLPAKGTPAGWHKIDDPVGLPNRYITDIEIDPFDATQQTVYASLGGYYRRWFGVGVAGDDNPDANTEAGNLFRSTDAGRTWSSVQGDMPNINIRDFQIRGKQLIVATDLGVFISSDMAGTKWAPLGGDNFPTLPVESIAIKADDPDFLLMGVYGGGMWTYEFPRDAQDVTRVAGPDRYATSAEVSKSVFASADTVVIARGDVFPDALAGSPLAAQSGGPLLLSKPSGLPSVIADEITRLGASNAIVLGGESGLSAQVVTDLETLGLGVRRLDGENRFDTAALIAAEIVDVDGLDGSYVYVAKGADVDPKRGWEDALSIGAAAAKDRRPILLTRTAELPAETIAAIADLGTPRAKIVGGRAAVSVEVERVLQGITAYEGRVAGRSRYGTAVDALDQGLEAGLTSDILWLARGDDFADSLSAGPAAAATGGSFLLINGTSLDRSQESAKHLRHILCAVDEVHLVGGESAINEEFRRELAQLTNGCADVPVTTPPAPSPVLGEALPDEQQPPSRTELTSFSFDDDNQGWTVATDGNPFTSWTAGAYGPEGSRGFAITKSGYQDLADTKLTSPTIALPAGNVVFSWAEQMDVEGGGFDETHLEINAGSGWERITTRGGQNVGYPEFSTAEAEYLSAGGDVQIRFLFVSDEICSGFGGPGACGDEDGWDGYALDDVTISTVD